MREFKGKVAWAVSSYGVLASLFHLYTAYFGTLEPYEMRSAHLLFLLPLTFLLFPATKRSPKDRPTRADVAWAFVTFVGSAYVFLHANALNVRWQGVSPVYPEQVVLGTIMILAVLEASRRAISPWFAATTLLFIAYLLASPYLPGLLWYRGYSYPRIVEMMYLSDLGGIYGFLTGISANILFVFILFAAFMMETGIGSYFMDLSVRLAGRSVAGPAKVAVLSSGLYGSISGSSVADAYATGSFTIPLMKRLGYRPVMAAAIEAVSSAGGPLAPPVMGAAAFVMSELTGIPYLKIAAAAALPAILYYVGILSTVHFEGARMGIRGVEDERIPSWLSVLKQSYRLLPLAAIIFLLVQGYAPTAAAAYSIVVAFVIGLLDPRQRMGLARLFHTLYRGAASAAFIAVALASAGIIVVTLTQTGLATSFGSLVVGVTGNSLLLALVAVMLMVSVLGTGIPTTPAYIIAVMVAASVFGHFGVGLLAANMFVFYFATLADIIPPVAVTAFATASIAGADPFRTGFMTPRFALAGFLVPFVFVFQPVLLTHAALVPTIVTFVSTGLGIVALSAALSGYVGRRLPPVHRALLGAVALLAILPSMEISILTSAILLLYFAWSWWGSRRVGDSGADPEAAIAAGSEDG